MYKIFIKSLLFSISFLLISYVSVAQSITITSVDPGPYGQGSTIAAIIKIDNSTGCIKQDNKFDLYLSDKNGSFASETKITSGNFTEFYTTFLNGVIPANTPAGTGYLLRVKSTYTAPSAPSSAFTVNAGPGVVAQVSSTQIAPATFPEVFGQCQGVAGTVFPFVNQSSVINQSGANATVTATINDELHAGTSTLNFTAANQTQNFTAATDHYTILVKAVFGGITGTKAYFLVNNKTYTNFNTQGIGTVCLPNALLTFGVDVVSASGIQNNFPGTIYHIQWGDKQITTYTICDIIAAQGNVSHTYLNSSCGSQVQFGSTIYYNSFGLNISDVSPFCGPVGTSVGTAVQAVVKPSNSFTAPLSGCTGSTVTFTNTSTLGQNPDQTSPICSNNNELFNWYVNDVLVLKNVKLNTNFTYKFGTKGTYTIKLTSQNTGPVNCSADDYTNTICIQDSPQPSFTLEGGNATLTKCAPYTVQPVNTSVIDLSGCQTNSYTWTLKGNNGVSFTSQGQTPTFPALIQAGLYQLTLTVNTQTCGGYPTQPQIIIINTAPTAKLSGDVTFCGTGTFIFDNTAGPTQTFLGGTSAGVTNPYKWTITETGGTGGADFVDGTTDISEYPHIKFNDNSGVYTVTATNTNTCGPTASATQVITFQNAPTISLGGPYPTLCPNSSVDLKATINGVVKSSTWITSGTGTFSAQTINTATYTPSQDDITAGNVKITLQAVTNLPAPCNSVSDVTTISIYPANPITSAPEKSICSGTALGYTITSAIAGSTFSWTIDPSRTSASITGYSNSQGTKINDVLNNTGDDYAIVAYIITPINQGCNGTPFTLAVKVAPAKATASFTQDITNGCGALNVNFTNTSTPQSSNFLWNFGDGTTSTDINPSHTFQPSADGKEITYNVTLKITSACIQTTSVISTVTVRPSNPTADIFPVSFGGCSPFTLTVNNLTVGTNYSYHYYLYASDGTLVQDIVTYDKNPVSFNPIVTTTTKQYTAYMVTTDLCGSTAQSKPRLTITVSAPTVFPAVQLMNPGLSPANSGCAPLSLVFVNLSVGGDKYFYNIYDADKNPITAAPIQATKDNFPYTFTAPGKYYVSISVQNSCTTLSESPLQEVDVYEIPKPDLSADNTKACKFLTVNFTNLTAASGITPASSLGYEWDFGDGSPHSYSFTPPPHTYYTNSKNLPYTVTLTATNPESCSNTVVKKDLIFVSSPPSADFAALPDSIIEIPNYHFDFEDKSTNGAVAWNWSFGDGQTSTHQNPGYTYAYGDTGVHKVTLTVFNKDGCDSTIVHLVHITGVPGQLFMPNAFIPTSSQNAIKIFMAKGSGIKTWHMQIFNNYGQLMWETTRLDSKGAPIDGWDGTFKGTPAPQGAYIWQVSATFMNGSEWKGMSYNNSLPKRTGTVNLIR